MLNFLPQTYHKMHGGYYTGHVHHVIIHLKYHDIKIPIDSKHANLPFITYCFVSNKDKEK